MGYQVIEASCYPDGKSALEKRVNMAIQEGWLPLGGVAVLMDPCDAGKPRKLYQAMTIRPQA